MTARLLSMVWWVLLASIFVLGIPYESHDAISSSLTDQAVTSSRPIGPGQRSEAELKAAIAGQPSELAPYRELAWFYSASGRRDEAERVLREALRVRPNSGAVFEALLSLFEFSREADKALTLAEEWMRAEPANPKAIMITVQALIYRSADANRSQAEAMADYDRALPLLDDLIHLSRDDSQPRAMKVMILQQKAKVTNDPDERVRLLRESEVAIQELAKTSQKSRTAASKSSLTGPPRQSAFPNAVRVGGNIRTPVKTKDVKPVFPVEAQQARVQGVVIFELTIDEAGKVAEARVLRSISLLDQAAEDAVRQWEFTPTSLNGKPVPVIMTVTVQFSLAPGQ